MKKLILLLVVFISYQSFSNERTVNVDKSFVKWTGKEITTKIHFGKLNIIPSFTPGLYREGDGKDLGHIVELKSELQFSLDLFENSELGFSYNHISNASLGEKTLVQIVTCLIF